MLAEGMADKVVQCPDCISSAAEIKGEMGLDELSRRNLVSHEDISRLQRQILRLSS